MRKQIQQLDCFLFHLVVLFAVDLGHGQQSLAKTGLPISGSERETSSIEWLAVRRQKHGQGPSALLTDRSDRRLITRGHIGTLVTVQLHGNVMLVDDGRDFI